MSSRHAQVPTGVLAHLRHAVSACAVAPTLSKPHRCADRPRQTHRAAQSQSQHAVVRFLVLLLAESWQILVRNVFRRKAPDLVLLSCQRHRAVVACALTPASCDPALDETNPSHPVRSLSVPGQPSSRAIARRYLRPSYRALRRCCCPNEGRPSLCLRGSLWTSVRTLTQNQSKREQHRGHALQYVAESLSPVRLLPCHSSRWMATRLYYKPG